jgi:predicted glycosyl hydrolase (DUF1957 family)
MTTSAAPSAVPEAGTALVLVLHAHLPWQLRRGAWPHGSDWLGEAVCDAYLPLLDALDALAAEDVPVRWTLGVTPVLAAQLVAPDAPAVLRAYVYGRLAAAAALRDDAAQDARTRELAGWWHGEYAHCLHRLEALDWDVTRAIRAHVAAGRLALMGSAATHAVLPLLACDESVRLQLDLGRCVHARIFGAPADGVWLPECAYRPRGWWQPAAWAPSPRVREGIDAFVREAGYAWTVVDAHLPRPVRSAMRAAAATPEPLVERRDPRAVLAAWAAEIAAARTRGELPPSVVRRRAPERPSADGASSNGAASNGEASAGDGGAWRAAASSPEALRRATALLADGDASPMRPWPVFDDLEAFLRAARGAVAGESGGATDAPSLDAPRAWPWPALGADATSASGAFPLDSGAFAFDSGAALDSGAFPLDSGVAFESGAFPLDSGVAFESGAFPLDSGVAFESDAFPLDSGVAFDSGAFALDSGAAYESGAFPLDSGASFDSGAFALDSGASFDSGAFALDSGAAIDSGAALDRGATVRAGDGARAGDGVASRDDVRAGARAIPVFGDASLEGDERDAREFARVARQPVPEPDVPLPAGWPHGLHQWSGPFVGPGTTSAGEWREALRAVVPAVAHRPWRLVDVVAGAQASSEATTLPLTAGTTTAGDATGALHVLVRDPVSARLVWSKQGGYPGSAEYLEFHRRDATHGLRLWRVTSHTTALDEKAPYDPADAARAAERHAAHFTSSLEALARDGARVVVAPFDAELFGHWWREGPAFLAHVTRTLAAGDAPVRLATARDALAPGGAGEAVLDAGSWGALGSFAMWLNERTAWLWRRLWPLEEAFWRVAPAALAHAAWHPVLVQAARELLLAQSSDWPFMLTRTEAADHAARRAKEHLAAAEALVGALASPDAASLDAALALAAGHASRDDLFDAGDVLAALRAACAGGPPSGGAGLRPVAAHPPVVPDATGDDGLALAPPAAA